MSQPTPYNRQYNFQNYQTVNPSSPLPANQVDAELNAVKITLDETLQNLVLIQRDDGALANASVGFEQLKPSLSVGFTLKGPWAAGVNYSLADGVTVGTKFYRCLQSHLSTAGLAPATSPLYWQEVADFSLATAQAEAARDAAIAAKVAAELAETNAELAETNAETAQTNAVASANLANDWATKTSAPVAGGEYSAKYNAQLAATSAANSANSASASATSATNSANSAAASAASATSAANSATSAGASASTATTKAAESSASAASAASDSATASSAATTATTQAGIASAASASANTYAANALSSQNAAASSASAAATSATNSANSASASASSASASAASAAAAAASYDSFDDRYLGPKASDPTLDNDGNALLQGALYFNTSTNTMKVYEGTTWLSAYASLSGALIASNNLSDLVDKPTARTNLGLGSAATQASSAFAAASHTHTASNISDSTAVGRTLLTAADAAAQRSALGLGTAALSATSDFAAASHTHTIANITNLQTSLDAKLNLSGGTLTGQLVSGAIASTMANGNTSSSLEIRNNGGTGETNMAMIGFHCQGSYGIKLGLRADGYLGIGGWSAATWQWYLAPGGHMVAAGNVTAYSDERLKRNWVDLADNLVDQIATIKAGSFERIDIGGRQFGVSAQSLQPIMPETVTEGVEGYLGVNYGNAALVASVALARRVMTLEARIKALEEKMA